MAVKVKIQMNPTQTILLKRGLNKDGSAQKFLTHELRRQMDPYVPFLSGTLKNSATETSRTIEYDQPYARRQYYENKGSGSGGTSNGGRRGMLWDKRCWADNGDAIVDSVAAYVGGKTGR